MTPWSAEHVADERLARRLVETQFPTLAPVRLQPLGVGWDNTAYLVNDAFVFRFPRRQIAVELLVDANKQLSGVIDWDDLHLGDPAIDLSIAYGFLPPSAREIFQRAYGSIDDGTWRLARFKALQTAVAVVDYGHDVGDADLLREGQIALRYIASA